MTERHDRRGARARRSVVGLLGAIVIGGLVGGPAGAATPPHVHAVEKTLTLPTSNTEAAALALDLDHDAGRNPDNQLGKVLAAFAAQGVDLVGLQASAITSGTMVSLHAIAADSLVNDRTAAWRVFVGKPKASPHLDGTDRLAVSPTGLRGTWLPGRIKNRRFTGGPGTIPLQIAIGTNGAPITLRLTMARIRARCTASGCTDGIVAGVLSKAQVDAVLVPGFADRFNAIVQASCPDPGDPCDATAQSLLSLFDNAPQDHTISVTEIAESPLVSSILKPDLDLFLANGKRGKDGVKESLSVGAGFTTVKATFKEPA
ncbi:MAG: hypothetical protein U0869_23730 [Chloroflexota bacterium]